MADLFDIIQHTVFICDPSCEHVTEVCNQGLQRTEQKGGGVKGSLDKKAGI